MQTCIELTKQERNALAALAKSSGREEAELIQEAIAAFLERKQDERRRQALLRLAGMWRNRDDLPNFAASRREWDRQSQDAR